MFGSWPLTHHPARAGFEHLTAAWVPDGSPLERVVSVGFTAAFVAATAGVALVVTDLGIVLHLLGGLCISFIIFFLPGLLLVNAAIVKWSKVVLEQIDTEAILEVRGLLWEGEGCRGDALQEERCSKPWMECIHAP